MGESVPENRDSHSNSSHEPSLQPTPARSVDSGKYSVCTHFPKDRNCEICQRNKISRAPCRRRIGGAYFVQKIWWFDYSRPPSSQWKLWISKQSSICNRGAGLSHSMDPVVSVQKQKLHRKNRSLQKILEPNRKPKVIYTDNSLEFGKACEDLSWNHCTSTPHWSETNEIAESAVRRVKEGTSAVLLQSSLDENWWADSMECKTYIRNIQDLLPDGEDALWKTFWATIQWTNHSVWFIGWVLPYFCERPVKNPSIWKESLNWTVLWIRSVRGREFGRVTNWLQTLETGNDGRVGNLLGKTQSEGINISRRRWKIHFSSRRWTNQTFWRRSGPENIHLDTGTPHSRRRSRRFSWRIRRVSFTTSWLTSRCLWSDEWFLVHVRKLHLPPSQPRVKLYSPREESFPIPLKFVDVFRTTRTNLDVMQERRIDDYWNIYGSRDLSASWTSFTQFTLLSEKPPDGYVVRRENWQDGSEHPSQIVYGQNSG